MKIKVKILDPKCELKITEKGDWIDLHAAEDLELPGARVASGKRITEDGKRITVRDFEDSTKLIPLGVAIKLPKGYEAVVASRSSTYKYWHIMAWNSIGIIDNSYQGEEDEWKFTAFAFKDTVIKKGDRICQFRIQLSQKATRWQKLKWLFSGPVKLKTVTRLNGKNRGGFGTSGKK